MGNDRQEARIARARRVRYSVKKAASGRLRLSVFRSARHIYAQIIDDSKGVTLVSASTLDEDLREQLKYGGNKEAAGQVGKKIAEKAVEENIKEVVFDRGGYLYHGRVKELAEAARAGGLEF